MSQPIGQMQVALPYDKDVAAALERLMADGYKKGAYVLQAVRERMQRDGLLNGKGARHGHGLRSAQE